MKTEWKKNRRKRKQIREKNGKEIREKKKKKDQKKDIYVARKLQNPQREGKVKSRFNGINTEGFHGNTA